MRQDAGEELLDQTVGALHEATRPLDDFGGIWIDRVTGPVIDVAVAGTWPDEVVRQRRSLVPAGQGFVLREVAVSLAELESLQERLTDVILSDPALRSRLGRSGWSRRSMRCGSRC